MGLPPPELQWHLLFWTWWYSKLGTGLENTSKWCYFGISSCRWNSNIPLSYSAMSLLLIASGIQADFLFSLNMVICWTRIVEMQLGLPVFFFFFLRIVFSYPSDTTTGKYQIRNPVSHHDFYHCPMRMLSPLWVHLLFSFGWALLQLNIIES